MTETTREIWFSSAGGRLFAVEQGAGPPVVFLHGGLADHRASLFRVGALAETHRLVLPDVRGAGRSVHAGDLDWSLLADDVAALLDRLELERAAVGGISAGSGVALAFALRHPQRCTALVLAWPVFTGNADDVSSAKRSAIECMAEAGQRALTEGIAAILPLYDVLPPETREFARAMASTFDPASVAATTRFLASGAQPLRGVDDLALLTMPTLVVPGSDPQHPAAVAEAYARVLPRCTLGDPTADLALVIAAFLGGQPSMSSQARR